MEDFVVVNWKILLLKVISIRTLVLGSSTWFNISVQCCAWIFPERCLWWDWTWTQNNPGPRRYDPGKKTPDIRNSGSLFSVKIYGIVLCLIFATQSGLSLYWVCRTCHFDERTSCIWQLPWQKFKCYLVYYFIPAVQL